MKKYPLIHLSTDNCLELRCYENDMCFDAPIQIFLCCAGNEYMLLDDILGYALSELRYHFLKMESLELIPELSVMEIGKAQNEYYYRCAKNLPLNFAAIKEVNERWIGNKYNCFESRNFSIWVYSLRGERYLKVTPLYSGNYDDDSGMSYVDFVKDYRIIYEKILQKKEVIQCQNMIKRIEELIN